jgi:hypothetical protein
LLEKPPEAVERLYQRISEDDCHNDVRLLLACFFEARMFPALAMLGDDAPTMSWSPAAVASGAL